MRKATVILLSLIAQAHPEVYCTLQAPALAPGGIPPVPVGAGGPPPPPPAGGVGAGGVTLTSNIVPSDYLISLNALIQSKPAFRNAIIKNIVTYRNFLKIFDSVVASGIFNQIKDDIIRITQVRYDFKEIIESPHQNIKAYIQFVQNIANDFVPLMDILTKGMVVPGGNRKLANNDLIEGMHLKIDAITQSEVKDIIDQIKVDVKTKVGNLPKANNQTKVLLESGVINYLEKIKTQLNFILKTPHDKQEFRPEDYFAKATKYQNKYPRNPALIL